MRILILFSLLLFAGCGPEEQVDDDRQVEAEAVEPDYVYKSEKYAFALKSFPKDYEVKYLEESGGIAFKRFVKADPNKNRKNPDIDYTSLIYILPAKNVEEYEDLNDLIVKKYRDYTFRFVDYGTISGFYVDDGIYVEANPHFFTMNKSGDIIYQVDMKLPSRYYPDQKGAFEEVVKSMVIF